MRRESKINKINFLKYFEKKEKEEKKDFCDCLYTKKDMLEP